MCCRVKLCASSPLSWVLGISVEERRAMNHKTSLVGSADILLNANL